MKVEGGGPAQSLLMQQLLSDRINQKAEGKAVDGSSRAADNFSGNRGKAKANGVIKKFQDSESHYKGVAELRLRINFADQLQESTAPLAGEAKGKGSAYGRFLEIYQSLGTGFEDTGEPVDVDESGDRQTEV